MNIQKFWNVNTYKVVCCGALAQFFKLWLKGGPLFYFFCSLVLMWLSHKYFCSVVVVCKGGHSLTALLITKCCILMVLMFPCGRDEVRWDRKERFVHV
jgi:hypothetical protein